MENKDLLTIEQLRKMKLDLHNEVNSAIIDFQQKTGLEVKEIISSDMGDFLIFIHNPI